MSALPDGVTREVWHDIDVLRIETPSSTARISLHGGQVLSFAPAGFDDLLWLSPTTAMPPKATRGGVPVCWPYFGRQGQPDDAPQHGLAADIDQTFVAATHATRPPAGKHNAGREIAFRHRSATSIAGPHFELAAGLSPALLPGVDTQPFRCP